MKKENPECIECGLLRSTTEAVNSPLCSRAKLAGGSHDFGDIPPNAQRTGDTGRVPSLPQEVTGRFDREFSHLFGLIKVKPNYGDDMEKAKALQEVYNNIGKDIKSFIASELERQKEEILNKIWGDIREVMTNK